MLNVSLGELFGRLDAPAGEDLIGVVVMMMVMMAAAAMLVVVVVIVVVVVMMLMLVFILIIGGAFWIVNDSKAFDIGTVSFLRKARKMENNPILRKIGIDNFLLTAIMLLFSIFGAVFGMSEETIAFCLVLVPMAISMGYDSITGVCMVFIAAGLGFAGAILNPFTIGIAQGLAGIPLFSGIEYRIVCWCIINVVASHGYCVMPPR